MSAQEKAEALLLAVECAIAFAIAQLNHQEGRVPLATVQAQHDRLRESVNSLVQVWEGKS